MEFKIKGLEVLKGKVNPEKTAEAVLKKTKGVNARGIIISTSAEKKEVDAVKKFGAGLGYTTEEIGLKVSESLASVCARVVEKEKFGRLVIAGGETSGTVCRYLGIKSLEVGLPLEPGIPYCFTVGKPEMLVVLKSGNFGSEDFYLHVQEL